jgi:SAM-dependent methyltransferase
MIDWEALWAPYTVEDYQSVLDQIEPWDVVLDIGAGDLRLAVRLARIAKKVCAIERNPQIIAQSDRACRPKNLSVICADALTYPFPNDVTVGVLLMRHCTHFKEYAARLALAGCHRLITNARWGMDVEAIDLRSGVSYDPDRAGWYACACGSIGFTPGDPQLIDQQVLESKLEVIDCPKCRT